MVASIIAAAAAARARRGVSIPFIAGQWSLPRINSRHWPASGPSQSPSLRGSGRFASPASPRSTASSGLNPLHCGAVVASRNRAQEAKLLEESQSPSLRGSGRFKRAQERAQREIEASQSPSLRGSGRFSISIIVIAATALVSQSPSLRGSGRFSRRRAPGRARLSGLNPLHCGAVVASDDA